jgi:hypothetical protein
MKRLALAAAAMAISPSIAFAQADAPIAAESIDVPDLRFTPTPGDESKYSKNFYVHKPGVDFATALADLAECEQIGAVTASPFERIPDFYPYGPEAPDPNGRRPDSIKPFRGLLPMLADGLVSKNILYANRRECARFKGYSLYGLPDAIWEAIEARGPEQALRIRAKIASGPTPVAPAIDR